MIHSAFPGGFARHSELRYCWQHLRQLEHICINCGFGCCCGSPGQPESLAEELGKLLPFGMKVRLLNLLLPTRSALSASCLQAWLCDGLSAALSREQSRSTVRSGAFRKPGGRVNVCSLFSRKLIKYTSSPSSLSSLRVLPSFFLLPVSPPLALAGFLCLGVFYGEGSGGTDVLALCFRFLRVLLK